MATITLDRVRKVFGETVAVDDISLEISRGKLVCFLGPSGCGKTTTLRMIAGLESPTAGEIRFNGVRVNETPPQARGVGMVFQNYALFTHLSVYENLAFGLRVRGAAAPEVDRSVRHFAELLELESVLLTGVSRLDLSTMQRVALGRTLITQPRVLLLDEPLNNIRPGLRETMRAELRRLQLELQQTAVYVTHDQEEALSLGDEIIVMRQARVEQVGTPEEVYHRPRNHFVATFVGSPTMNVLPCRLEDRNGRPMVVADGFLLPGERWAGKREGGRELLLGIRPDRVTLGSGALQAQVSLVQPAGPEQVIELVFGEQRLKAVVARNRRFSPGEAVRLDFPTRDLYLFDARSGEVLYG